MSHERTDDRSAAVRSRRRTLEVLLAAGLLLAIADSGLAAFPQTPARRCAPDAVLAGTVCLDAYEASVWRVPDPSASNATLVRKIQLGRATREDLVSGGATQLGTADDDYAPCRDDGQNCAGDIYAVSLPSELPSAFVTWFQAQEACANSGKRLPTNAEWQVGANGTPDPGPDDRVADCNTASTATTTLTGSRSRCVSARGAFDMVGNVAEWTADWVPLATDCPGWGAFSDDIMCLAGASTTATGPAALLRGGLYFGGGSNGPLVVIGTVAVTRAEEFVGFRCAR